MLKYSPGDFGLAANFRGGGVITDSAEIATSRVEGAGGDDDVQELTHGVGTTL